MQSIFSANHRDTSFSRFPAPADFPSASRPRRLPFPPARPAFDPLELDAPTHTGYRTFGVLICVFLLSAIVAALIVSLS